MSPPICERNIYMYASVFDLYDLTSVLLLALENGLGEGHSHMHIYT